MASRAAGCARGQLLPSVLISTCCALVCSSLPALCCSGEGNFYNLYDPDTKKATDIRVPEEDIVVPRRRIDHYYPQFDDLKMKLIGVSLGQQRVFRKEPSIMLASVAFTFSMRVAK